MIDIIDERARFFNIDETIFINIDSITILISVFVVKRSDHELFLEKFFQRTVYMSFININNEIFEMILYFLNKKKRVNFLKMFAEHVSNKKKVCVYNNISKRLNNDLINIFVRKFKSDRHESFKARVKSFRVVHEVSFKLI